MKVYFKPAVKKIKIYFVKSVLQFLKKVMKHGLNL
jgi:hypothetical protein